MLIRHGSSDCGSQTECRLGGGPRGLRVPFGISAEWSHDHKMTNRTLCGLVDFTDSRTWDLLSIHLSICLLETWENCTWWWHHLIFAWPISRKGAFHYCPLVEIEYSRCSHVSIFNKKLKTGWTQSNVHGHLSFCFPVCLSVWKPILIHIFLFLNVTFEVCLAILDCEFIALRPPTHKQTQFECLIGSNFNISNSNSF